jgi:hypothetical protein
MFTRHRLSLYSARYYVNDKAKAYPMGPVCRECALAKGWKPTDKIVGNWVDVCSFCKTEQSCCAVRDWVN